MTATEALQNRITGWLSLLEEQKARNADKADLEAIGREIRKLALNLAEAKRLEAQTPNTDQTVRFEDGEKDPQDFHYNRPKTFGVRKTIRKGTRKEVKRAHPLEIPWHGRLA